MSSNQCPKCQQEAMDAMTKLMRRPHVCQHCGEELRMNLVLTSVLSLVFFILAVRTMVVSGFSSQSMIYVLLMTVVFVVACLFIPLESKEKPESGS